MVPSQNCHLIIKGRPFKGVAEKIYSSLFTSQVKCTHILYKNTPNILIFKIFSVVIQKNILFCFSNTLYFSILSKSQEVKKPS